MLTALIVPTSGFLASRYGTRMTRNFRELFGRVGQFNARIEENVGGMRVVQAFANEDHERALFAVDNQHYRRTKLAAYRLMAASTSLSYLSMRGTQIVVMVAGTWFVLHGELSAGGFVGFLLLINVFFRPVEKINSVMESYPKGIAGFRRYTELLDTEPDIVDVPDAIGRSPACAATSATRRSRSVTSRAGRCSTGSTSRSAPARQWPSSGRRAPARRRSARCCRASTRRAAGASPSTASTSAR